MGDLGETFDPDSVEPSAFDGELLPNGSEHEAHITETRVDDTKSGGKMLVLRHDILSGPFKNRVVWSNINIRNSSAQAQTIGRQQLASVFKAVGAPQSDDSAVLKFKPLVIRVGIEKSDGYADKNVVKAWKPLKATAAAPRPPVARAAASGGGKPAPAAGGRPWARAAAKPQVSDDDIPF